MKTQFKGDFTVLLYMSVFCALSIMEELSEIKKKLSHHFQVRQNKNILGNKGEKGLPVQQIHKFQTTGIITEKASTSKPKWIRFLTSMLLVIGIFIYFIFTASLSSLSKANVNTQLSLK